MQMKVKAMFKKAGKVAASSAVGAGALVGSAHAAIDTASVVTAITDAGAAVAVVGAAYLVMKVGTRVFKWIAAAL